MIFLSIDQKDEETWYDKQEHKTKIETDKHTKTRTNTLNIVDEKKLSTILMTLSLTFY